MTRVDIKYQCIINRNLPIKGSVITKRFAVPYISCLKISYFEMRLHVYVYIMRVDFKYLFMIHPIFTCSEASVMSPKSI